MTATKPARKIISGIDVGNEFKPGCFAAKIASNRLAIRRFRGGRVELMGYVDQIRNAFHVSTSKGARVAVVSDLKVALLELV